MIPDSLQSVRERLDRLQISDVCWEPYVDHRAEHPFPDIAWYSGCIKCGLVVEPYHPEWVLRQFYVYVLVVKLLDIVGYVYCEEYCSMGPRGRFYPCFLLKYLDIDVGWDRFCIWG